jgi:hypothetical protein
MEYQKIRFNHDSYSQLIKLLTQRELYLNQKPYTKALHSDPYIVKRFNKPVSFTGHEGCVNTVVWNDAGNLILSGSGVYKEIGQEIRLVKSTMINLYYKLSSLLN